MTLKVHTFIGRLICHIPDKHFPMIRYAGLFSNRWKEQYPSQARIALKRTENDDTHTYTLSLWAELQTEYTGINPLICPNCDQPLTYVGTFVFAQYPVYGRSGIKPDPSAIKCRAAFDMPPVQCDWILYPLLPQVIEHIRTSFGNWNELPYLFDTARKDPAIPSASLRAG